MNRICNSLNWALLFSLLLALCLTGHPAAAETKISLSRGQTVYVAVYSHIYSGDRGRPFPLAVTLSIRNTDPAHAIRILSADYYDSDGKLLQEYLKNPVTLNPMASIRYLIKESDTAGGSGANFIVRWAAETDVNSPLIESIMIGARSQQGISFTSPGIVIKEMR